MANYNNWLDGEIGGKRRDVGAKPPRLGLEPQLPSLYGGNMLVVGELELPGKAKGKTPFGSVQIKLLGVDSQWAFSTPLKVRNYRVITQKENPAPGLGLNHKTVAASGRKTRGSYTTHCNDGD